MKPHVLSFSFKALASLADGTKTSFIASVAEYPDLMGARSGTRLRAGESHWRRGATRRLLGLDVVYACWHAHIGEIPACGAGHDPHRMFPDNPTWGKVLGDAVTYTPEAKTGKGWIVVDVIADPRPRWRPHRSCADPARIPPSSASRTPIAS